MRSLGLVLLGLALGMALSAMAGTYLVQKFRARLDRWEHPQVAQRWAGPDAGPVVAFIGASITADWKLGEAMPDLRTLNAGLGSDFTGHELVRFRRDVLAHDPDVVVIKPCAINLIRSGFGQLDPPDPQIVRDALAMMCDLARAHGAVPILCTPVPVGSHWLAEQDDPGLHERVLAFAEWIRDYAREHGVLLADYHAALADEDGLLPEALGHDGLHVGKDGYARMRDVVRPLIDQALDAQEELR